MKKYIVKDTKRYGKGVFANSKIAQGEIIGTLTGRRMDVIKFVDEVLEGKELVDYALQIGRRTYLHLEKPWRFFNHSCNPTCGIRKNNELFALREISKNEELTFDYSMTIAPTDWQMKCKCGSHNCRKMLGDVLSVPIKQRNNYIKLGALQTFMKRLLNVIESGHYKMPSYEKIALERLGDKKYDI